MYEVIPCRGEIGLASTAPPCRASSAVAEDVAAAAGARACCCGAGLESGEVNGASASESSSAGGS